MKPQPTTSISMNKCRINSVNPRRSTYALSSMKRLAAGITLALGINTGMASTPATPNFVGEVSLVLGKAWVKTADGSRELIRIGTRIGVEDLIETGSNGHVHLRFIDKALVSVRPSSQLEIIRYDYNQQNPAASVVKLNLIEGVIRAISGKAAQNAKDNFRMNTPIAAIGVRGTDFVVSASRQSVRALVNEGSIILAPFSSSCSAETLGPCSQNALELASGGSQFIEINASALEPVLLSIPGTAVPEVFLEPPELMVTGPNITEHEEDGGSDIYTESVTSLAVNKTITSTKETVTVPESKPTPKPEPIPEPLPVPEFTPDLTLSADELMGNNQLVWTRVVWGRWSEDLIANQRITVSYEQAIESGRAVTVGPDSGYYALYRIENGSKEVKLKPGLGVLDFDLKQAQAMLKTAGGRELMDVYGGLLNIDIENRAFSTSLQLGHPATGRIEYSDSGLYFSGGVFRNRSDGKITVGSLSIDGTEAGYSFETTVDAGKIEGLTLWSVQP